ncbi:MAG: hypothetical protein ACRD99_01645 [Nitrososphaera sp.]
MGTGVDDAIVERIAFLKEQISPDNNPQANVTLQHEVAILETADLQKLEMSIGIRKTHLEKTPNRNETERLFCEPEALEWPQRAVKGRKA